LAVVEEEEEEKHAHEAEFSYRGDGEMLLIPSFVSSLSRTI
jgi:hypothetical protein